MFTMKTNGFIWAYIVYSDTIILVHITSVDHFCKLSALHHTSSRVVGLLCG